MITLYEIGEFIINICKEITLVELAIAFLANIIIEKHIQEEGAIKLLIHIGITFFLIFLVIGISESVMLITNSFDETTVHMINMLEEYIENTSEFK